MPVTTALLDMLIEPTVNDVDERWTMAFSAALGHRSDHYFDTTSARGIVAHPLFAVCPEWEAIVASRSISEHLGMTHVEDLTGIHATHDVTVHRLVRPGDRLTTRLAIVGVTDISPGAKVTTRLTTVDADGRPVATTTQDAIYLGVHTRADHPDPSPPQRLADAERHGDPFTASVDLDAGAAHTYTECARIWNPIHTDRAVARAAGLPDIILHGTATLAMGVSAVIDQAADGEPALVQRISGRFAAMVELPSRLFIDVWPGNRTADGQVIVPFEVRNQHDLAAVRDGLIVLADRSDSHR